MIIKGVDAKIIKDSRGTDTISVSVNDLEEASSPNGKSVGIYETPPYHKSLRWCVDFLNAWCDEVRVDKFEDLVKVEKIICKNTSLKDVKKFGANALYAFESAILKALAQEQGSELWQIINKKAKKIPKPVGNVVGGGLHSEKALKHPTFQEFLVIPQAGSIMHNVNLMNTFYKEVGKRLKAVLVNDEGAWLVSSDDETVLDAMQEVQLGLGKKIGANIELGLDIAASALYKNRLYFHRDEVFSIGGHESYTDYLINHYHLGYVEDPFEQNDFKYFTNLTKSFGKNSLVVGDDLIATQYNRLATAIRTKSINAVIVKPNQNGSLLELKKIFDLCKKNKIKTVMSHRSGETMDSALADYAVGFGADYIKCGVATKWREAKLQRLVEIEKST